MVKQSDYTPLVYGGLILGGLFLFKDQIKNIFGGVGDTSKAIGTTAGGIATGVSGLGQGINTIGRETGETYGSFSDVIQAANKRIEDFVTNVGKGSTQLRTTKQSQLVGTTAGENLKLLDVKPATVSNTPYSQYTIKPYIAPEPTLTQKALRETGKFLFQPFYVPRKIFEAGQFVGQAIRNRQVRGTNDSVAAKAKEMEIKETYGLNKLTDTINTLTSQITGKATTSTSTKKKSSSSRKRSYKVLRKDKSGTPQTVLDIENKTVLKRAGNTKLYVGLIRK